MRPVVEGSIATWLPTHVRRRRETMAKVALPSADAWHTCRVVARSDCGAKVPCVVTCRRSDTLTRHWSRVTRGRDSIARRARQGAVAGAGLADDVHAGGALELGQLLELDARVAERHGHPVGPGGAPSRRGPLRRPRPRPTTRPRWEGPESARADACRGTGGAGRDRLRPAHRSRPPPASRASTRSMASLARRSGEATSIGEPAGIEPLLQHEQSDLVTFFLCGQAENASSQGGARRRLARPRHLELLDELTGRLLDEARRPRR